MRLHFTDGLIQDVNLAPVFERGRVFSAIRDDRSIFEQVRVNPESSTVEWPGEIDLEIRRPLRHRRTGRRPAT